jgi:YesN/AraC family two-component response regulator
MPRSILFVDDEPMVLSGLKRSLHGMRREWEMEFVAGGQEALRAMGERPFDIVVTDMQMPVMDGATLLQEIKRLYPQCLRFVLSGQADLASILKTVNPAHQFLAKPCEAAELQKRLTRALAVRNLLQNEELRGLVSKLDSLPTLPALYTELVKELDKSEPSIPRIGQLVTEDMGLTAKVLQLVNWTTRPYLQRIESGPDVGHRHHQSSGRFQPRVQQVPNGPHE